MSTRPSLRRCQQENSQLISVDYDNYDYALHHTSPFNNNTNSTHSPLDVFFRESQLDKALLRFSTREDKRKYMAAMEEKLAAFDRMFVSH
jgi:hypothetical protein